MLRYWPIFAAGALLLGLAACTSLPTGSLVSYSPVGGPVATLPVSASPATGRTLGAGPAALLTPSTTVTTSSRLLVQGDDGNIYITRPDGSDTQALTRDASPTHLYLQPTWSPLGDRVAWVEALVAGSVVTSSLHVGRPDGSGASQVATTAPPFYLFWSPDGSRLAYLANGDQGLDLTLFEPDNRTNPLHVLDRGSPLYFSWAPDGQRLLTHAGTDRLAVLNLDGTQTPLSSEPASFAAPRWGADGAGLLYATLSAGQQQLVLADLKGTVRRNLANFDGNLSFELRPGGQEVAYVDTVAPVPGAAFGPLYVTGLAGGTAQRISDGPVVAFFWSPDGRFLLYLVLETAAAPPNAPKAAFHFQQDQSVWMTWHVWGERQSLAFGRFVPSSTLLQEYLAFFDQYAQSMTLWAPDGSAFTYAGTDESGQTGIWVQSLKAGAAAVRVAPGEMANWSPR